MNPVYWLGIGFQQKTSRPLLESAIITMLSQHHLGHQTIAGIATLDSKATSNDLADICQSYQWQLLGFSAIALNQVIVPHPSKQAQNSVSTRSVAEAAALLACQTYTPQARLLAPKTIFKQPNLPGSVTLAIAGYADVPIFDLDLTDLDGTAVEAAAPFVDTAT